MLKLRDALAPSAASGGRQPIDGAIDQVKNRKDETTKILTATRVVKLAMGGLAVLLVVASILLISNTIRLSLFSRRREVEVMKLVGATDSFIRLPFVIEGVVLGALGGVLAMLLLGIGKVAFLDPLASDFALIAAPADDRLRAAGDRCCWSRPSASARRARASRCASSCASRALARSAAAVRQAPARHGPRGPASPTSARRAPALRRGGRRAARRAAARLPGVLVVLAPPDPGAGRGRLPRRRARPARLRAVRRAARRGATTASSSWPPTSPA